MLSWAGMMAHRFIKVELVIFLGQQRQHLQQSGSRYLVSGTHLMVARRLQVLQQLIRNVYKLAAPVQTVR